MSQSGMVSIFQDFPFSPDMVSEIKVVTSSYEPQYGSSTSRPDHGHHQVRDGPVPRRGLRLPPERRPERQASGAPRTSRRSRSTTSAPTSAARSRSPACGRTRSRAYFYVDVEGFRQTGGANRPTLSIPSLKERAGDFSDWRDANGNLIPIYDPATTRVVRRRRRPRPLPRQHHPGQPDQPPRPAVAAVPAPAHERQPAQQLPGADRDTGHHPGRHQLLLRAVRHVRRPEGPPVRLHLAPARPGEVLLAPAPRDRQRHLLRPAELVGQPAQLGPHLRPQPPQPPHLRLPEPERGLRQRQRRRRGQAAEDRGRRRLQRAAPDLASATASPSGAATPASTSATSPRGRPTRSATSSPGSRGATRSRSGASTATSAATSHTNGNQAGSFSFGRGATGVLGENSGNPIASFLLGAVDSGNVDFRTAPNAYPRQTAWIFHAGDTWNVDLAS